MPLLTGHLRERRASARARDSERQEESSYRVRRAEGQWQKSGRRVGSESARAGLPKQRVIGLYATRPAAPPPTGYTRAGVVGEANSPPPLHPTRRHARAFRGWRDAPRRVRDVTAAAIFVGGFTAEWDQCAKFMTRREGESVSSPFTRVLQRRDVGAHWARRGSVRR